MGKLHEILAVEGDLNGEMAKVTAEAIATFGKHERFLGSVKRLEMFDDSRQNEAGIEHQALTTTVGDKLDYIQKAIVKAFDAFLQKETTNQVAKADLIVDEKTLASNVPATALLGLESKMKDIRNLFDAIPTLAPGIEWVLDSQTGPGVYKTVHDKMTMKTEKSIQVKICVEATKEHPAQIEKWNADVPVGKYISTTICGMLSPSDKSVLLGRIDTLIRAIKQARMRANSVDVIPTNIGEALFGFIMGGK